VTLAQVERLRRLGCCVIPVKPKSKEPACDWKIFQSRMSTDAEARYWFGQPNTLNAAIVLGPSKRVVIEPDGPEAETLVASMRTLQTPMMTRSYRGTHHYFREPAAPELIPASFTVCGVTVEIKRRHQYVLAPGSVHPSGHIYTEVSPWPDSLEALPVLPLAEILATAEQTYGGGGGPLRLPDVVPTGDRHAMMRDLLRSMQARGVPLDGALAACHCENANRCHPPLPRADLDVYLRRVWRLPDRSGFERHPQEGWELAGALLEVGMSVDATLIAVQSVTPDFNPEVV
jgi:hypothetical protein